MKTNAILLLTLALSCLPLAASEPGKTIPFDQLGAAADNQSSDPGAGITPTATGAILKAVIQDLEAEGTPEGELVVIEDTAETGFSIASTGCGSRHREETVSFITN